MTDTSLAVITNIIREAAHDIRASQDYDALMELIGDAHFVLIGEASHGTHEFYQERATITKRLITEKGFTAVETHALEPLDRTELWERGEIPETFPSAL